jgi:hypothetical protein
MGERLLSLKISHQGERRGGNRRGKGSDAQDAVKQFIQRYWAHYYRDFPENDRRLCRIAGK